MLLSDARLMGPIVAVFVALVGVYLSISMGISAWAIVLVALAACMFVGYPRRLLALYFVWLTISGMMEAMFGRMIFIIWLDELLTLLMLGVVIVTRIETGKSVKEFKVFNRILLSLAFLWLLSFLANRPPLRGALHFALAYFRFFLIFYYTRRFMTEDLLKWFVWLFGAIFALQLVFNFGWLLHLNPLPNEMVAEESVDFAIGTWLGAPTCAYMALAVVMMSVSLLRVWSSLRRRFLVVVALFVALGQIWITYTVHAYMLCVLGVGAQIMLLSKRTVHKIAILFLTIVAVLLCYRPLERMIEQKKLRVGEQLTFTSLKGRLLGMLDGTKGKAYKDVIYTVPREHLRFPLLGAGPGNFASAMGRMYRRPLAERYINYVLTVSSYREYVELSEGGSITGMPYSGLLALWGDLGPIGAILYLVPFMYAMGHVWLLRRQGLYCHHLQQVLAEVFILIVPMFLFLNVLTDYFHNAFLHGGIWCLTAVVWTPLAERKIPVETKEAIE